MYAMDDGRDGSSENVQGTAPETTIATHLSVILRLALKTSLLNAFELNKAEKECDHV